ncbi:hypothetical protein ACSBR2_011202 [Camellia fascicularis]
MEGFSGAEKTTNPNVRLVSPTAVNISNLNQIIRHLLYTIIDYAAGPILVQFWAPITTKEGRSFLTTRNQPFILKSRVYGGLGIEGLCGYRMICMDSKFDIDLDGGKTCEQHLPARVFNHQFPESTPNVEFYFIIEYPQRHNALRCGLQESLAFPVFESSTQRCVGVIEVVTPEADLCCSFYFQYRIYKDFEKFGVKCSVVFDHEAMELDDDKNEAHKVAFDEIKNVLKRVCDVHDVPFAQAWVPCKMGWLCRALVDGGILHASCCYKKVDYGEDEDYYDYDKDDYGEYDEFRRVSSLSHLKNGVGVVGRALLSTNMVFCRDVTQLSLTEYPLAHYAREAGLSDCFAICLESNCTGNDVYVLEFFMPMNNNAIENPHTSLRKILETMRKNLSCFRVASREELGEELHMKKLVFKMVRNLILLKSPKPPYLCLGWNSHKVKLSTKHNNFAITCTQEKSTIKVSKRKGNKSGGTVKASKKEGNNIGVKIKILLEDILQNSALSLENAAKNLKVSKSTLKRICRPYGVERWPPHINKVGCSQLDESAPCVNSDHLPSTQSLATIVHTEPHDTAMQDANIVTIKAKYGEGITIKFRLSLSSTFVQLQQEVAKRLDLKAGTYYVKYEDVDGELILIGCDKDLQDYMRDSRSLGRSSIVVLLEQKLPITDHKK